ncbi:MAG: peptide chain release factor N(5)-glutamine methyltransferase [Kineosporiaceae bacterium]
MSRPADVPARGESAVELAALLRGARERLAAAGVPSPAADADQLAAHALGVGLGELAAAALRGIRIDPATAGAIAALVDARASRVPLQHLTGRAAFRTVELAVGPGVFVPRPETEVVAGLAVDEAAALAHAGRPPLVVDLGTGSGAIAIAVAVEVPAARVVAVELDLLAHAWARRNVDALAPGTDLRLGNALRADTGVLADLARTADVVVTNPPYIPDGARPVDPEVADHDPGLALYGGGADGLDIPRGVVAAAAGLLRPGGLLVLEHGDAQGPAARRLVAGPGWYDVRTAQDLTGRPRALLARRG